MSVVERVDLLLLNHMILNLKKMRPDRIHVTIQRDRNIILDNRIYLIIGHNVANLSDSSPRRNNTTARFCERSFLKACIAVLMLIISVQGALGSAPCIATELERTFGGSEDDEGQSVLMASDGGYIMAGSTKSDSAGGYDAWLLKADIEGNKIWSKTFGGPRDDRANSVQQTSDDGYIITGATRSTGAGGDDLWVIKTDKDGSKIWDKTFGGRLDDEGNSIRQTADGGYIIAGKTRSVSSDGNYDASLLKIDKFGNEIWDRTFGGALDDEADLALPTSDGGYIIAGATSSYGAGGYDAWLIKTDGEGNKVWDKTFGGVDSELNPWSKGWSVEQTDDGGYILVGSTKSYGSGGYDIWAIKTDEMGNKIWDKTFGGPLDDEGDSVLKTSEVNTSSSVPRVRMAQAAMMPG